MKCLSIRQPWATLIVGRPHDPIMDGNCSPPRIGPKDVENRHWCTSHRGAIAIHASKTIEMDELCLLEENALAAPGEDYIPPTGAIIGVARITNCSRKCQSDWHGRGSYGLYLDRRLPLRHPIVYKGQLKLFDLPPEIVDGILTLLPLRICQICGCSHHDPCIARNGNTCGWADEHLCTFCAARALERRPS